MINLSDNIIKIRKAKLGDEKQIISLLKKGIQSKSWEYTGNNTIKKGRINWMKKEFSKKYPNNYHFIAIDKVKKMVVGFVSFGHKPQTRLRHRIDLSWGVHPDYQNQGIASALLAKSLDYAKKRGFKRAEAEIAVTNIQSMKLAKKSGFKIEGKKIKAFLSDDNRYISTYIVGKLL